MRFLMLVLVLCGISFAEEHWDYSYSPPRKIYVEDPDTTHYYVCNTKPCTSIETHVIQIEKDAEKENRDALAFQRTISFAFIIVSIGAVIYLLN